MMAPPGLSYGAENGKKDETDALSDIQQSRLRHPDDIPVSLIEIVVQGRFENAHHFFHFNSP